MKSQHLVSSLIAILAPGVVFFCSADNAHSEAPIPRNLSLIVTAPAGPTQSDPGVSKCSDLGRYRDSLGDIGLTASGLTKDLDCVVADFDSNGYLDFVIWGPLEPGRQGLRGTRKFKVLFFDAQSIMRTEVIRKEDYDHALLWPRGSGHSGACQVSPQARDGVKLPGEGGGTWFYIYDPASGGLRGELVCDE